MRAKEAEVMFTFATAPTNKKAMMTAVLKNSITSKLC